MSAMKSLLLTLGAGLVAGLPSELGDVLLDSHVSELPALGLTDITKIGIAGGGDGLERRRLDGPFMGFDFPDPSLIWGDGAWRAYATSSGGLSVPVANSTDTFDWQLSGDDALPDPGPWVDPNDKGVWAPDVQKNDDGVYVMYYTAHQAGGSHCIGAATSKTAVGPFTPQAKPLICDPKGGGVIDASGYDDGKDRWIVWKVDGNNLGGATTCQGGTPSGKYKSTAIRIQRLARDALTFQGKATTILDNFGAADNGVVEAPALYQIPGDAGYVLFFSTHCYSTDDYDIQYAFSDKIDGKYNNRGSLLRTSDGLGIYGPGGLDIDPNGKSVVFHGRLFPNQPAGARELYSAELTFNGRNVHY
ncbi:glycoside hydrolase family 43 protein [Hypoxylon sp. NC1633]|nr:glycoside hydrolase family 43 protein [Hypoxylon sp. NC1633]